MVTQTSINGENAGLGATSEKIELNDDLIQRIKQEVLDAVREEIAAIRRDVNTDFPSTTRGAVAKQPTIVRNPKNIKEEIRKLKKEMKEMKIKKKSVERSKKQSASSITRKFAASFICENLCDGSCVSIGESFVKYWVLKNEGARVWDGKVTLELIQESPSLGSSVDPAIDFNNLLKWGPQITSVQVPIVQPSGTAVLAVTHVAPAYPCAYTSSWCLQR
uniref:Nbr1 FW domain-containing protein n=2 Tax=Ciona intestinalis TaxID=7719 RepID=F6T4G2_CIOIN